MFYDMKPVLLQMASGPFYDNSCYLNELQSIALTDLSCYKTCHDRKSGDTNGAKILTGTNVMKRPAKKYPLTVERFDRNKDCKQRRYIFEKLCSGMK